MNENSLLRSIPKVDDILNQSVDMEAFACSPRRMVLEAVREVLEELRRRILLGAETEVPSNTAIIAAVAERMKQKAQMSLRPVINATGIVLNTNLGRAKMGAAAAEAVLSVAQGYSTLEYDLEKGTRGSRYAHVEKLLAKLTGAESALVVNNNAAAMLLVLNTITKDKKEVVISRGELVEIGGSFRIPEILKLSGGVLAEVGTTNKTHFFDYENAVHSETAALLKVHTSNFKTVGFTEAVPLCELVELGKRFNLPVIHDAGSGLLVDLERFGITGEPTVQQNVADGADVVCFSGDKLLGGPQAGIVVGRRSYIEAMKKNQLARALRVDKLTLAALEATLRMYEADTAEQIPTLQMIAAGRDSLAEKARRLCDAILELHPACTAQVAEEFSQIGGGSVPGQVLATYVVAVRPHGFTVMELEARLRQGDMPVIARISKGVLLLDVRTLDAGEFSCIAARIHECAGTGQG